MIRFSKPCGECGGEGLLPLGYETSPEVPYPCPSCVGGWLPDDDALLAGAKAMLHAGGHYSGMTQAFVDDFRTGLVAAARYQSEEAGGEFSECETGGE